MHSFHITFHAFQRVLSKDYQNYIREKTRPYQHKVFLVAASTVKEKIGAKIDEEIKRFCTSYLIYVQPDIVKFHGKK